MADDAKFIFTIFWAEIMDGVEISSTKWGPEDIPN